MSDDGGRGGKGAEGSPSRSPSSSSSVAGAGEIRPRRRDRSGLLSGVKRLVAFEGIRDNTIAAGAVGAWGEYCDGGSSSGGGEASEPRSSASLLSATAASSSASSSSSTSSASPSPSASLSSRFELVKVDGDHYFVTTSMRKVTDVVSRVLLDIVEGDLLGEGHSWVAGA